MTDSDLNETNTGWAPLDEPGAAQGFDDLLGEVLVRSNGPGHATARFATSASHANRLGSLHGGYLAAIAEQCLFLPLYLDHRVTRTNVVTIDFTVQYLASGVSGAILEADLQVLRETGKLAYIRGTLRQHGEIILSYSGTLRKLRAP